ncbi:polyphosphoinositide phosphatase [Stemphylium lycopersici]|uniref:Polyphosphoinositide phosphatase n=1 Tax=Stemphylium lycopersici TaxID=183478 RepID=A0A364N1X0_STELY|nr:polyphosphoinositide phosphatase [Stemphylium lycopersici]RAQ99905.1 polyphosphoinositide phosphatase [Stemphylium lycopersici]RAR09671.1 polyphosphoinositide phosphatase [Stemphylium lycopersici]
MDARSLELQKSTAASVTLFDVTVPPLNAALPLQTKRSMPSSSRPTPQRLASSSTNGSSPKFTPSPRTSHSSDGLSMTHEPNAFELRIIPPRSKPVSRDELEEEDGDQDEAFLPSARRPSLDSVQSYELYTPDEDRTVLKKLDRRLVAFMALLYMLSFLDRSNIGNARIAGLADDLKLSSAQYEWLLWAFYITYILFEWMTLMYRIVPPHIYISLCILSWGVIASLQAVANSFGFLLAMRALLGVSEAAFGPGVPFYLSFFFRRHELAFRTGLFISASPLSASFAGALAYVITKIGEHGPLSPWRLLFLLEGFPSVLVAVWAWDFVPDGPGLAKWLSPRQREVAVMRLRSEKEGEDQDEEDEKYQSPPRRAGVNLHEVLQTLKDPKSYLTAFMFFSCNVAFSSMPVFLPTVIRDMGWESITAQGLSAPPYLFAFIVVLLTAYYSDRLQSRSTFIMLHSLLATIGYGTIAISGYLESDNTTLRYLALYPAAAGFFSAITIIITWTLNNQESDSKKGTGMAILNIIGQMGPLVGTSVFPDEDGPYYVKGMSTCAAFMLLVGILAAVLRSKSRLESPERASSIASRATTSHESTNQDKLDDIEKASTVVGSPQASPLEHDNNFKPEADLEKLPGHGKSRRESASTKFGGEEENPNVNVSFHRPSTPSTVHKLKGSTYQNVGESGIKRMHKFSLYETSSRFYLIGADITDRQFRVLKIDRTAAPGHLNIFEDDIVYNRREMHQLLDTIADGNKATGGMKLKCSTWGLLGFIRFTEAYYMLLISKRSQVAMLGGHYIYQVDGTEMVPLTTGSTSRYQKDRNPEEARFLSILNNMDLTRSFYFAYSYNVTRSLQQNIIQQRTALSQGISNPDRDFQDMFVWNHHLLNPARDALKNVYDWCHPVIHGYVDQSSLDVFGRRVYLTIIARRSRFFAGARFLKRGTNDLGYVANDVETEQIVSEQTTTSFHAPGPRLYANPTYTSYVQHRGSIPLYWTQDNTGVTPKPDIDLNLVDPFYSAAALHFDNLFERYGAPVYVLNLIKARERTPRESKLLHEYKHAIDYLNQSLPRDKKIIYEAFDMSRAAKTRGQDVIGTLENLAEKVMRKTGFFRNGDGEFDEPQVQNGVARTNCIDCLDRTNAAQFVIGKRALGRQLQALGVISGTTVEYDSDCVELFTQMFHGHGDTIAIQYGGSHLVNTMATYRKINQWQSSSRDMVESFKRYYHNSFLDSQRQEAYNLFLGNYIYSQGQPMLWDLSTDYYLHHQNPRTFLERTRRDYIQWYTLSHLQQRTLPPSVMPALPTEESAFDFISFRDDYWLEYYRPLAISSYLKIFAFRLAKPRPGRDSRDGTYPSRKENMSPFVPRKKQQEIDAQGRDGKKGPRKGVTIVDPSSETESRPDRFPAPRGRNLHLNVPHADSPVRQSILRDPHFETQAPASTVSAYQSMNNSTSTSTGLSSTLKPGFKPANKALVHQWTLTQFYENSMNPSVSHGEEDEYLRYVEHPLNLPLVVSSEMPSADDPSAMEFYDYLSMTEGSIPAPKDFDEDGVQITLSDLPLGEHAFLPRAVVFVPADT